MTLDTLAPENPAKTQT
jgi:hypothetical protein